MVYGDDPPRREPRSPRIQAIFRELIVQEIRNGRLSTARRRRIVQYSAQLGLSAVQTGRMIDECRKEVLADDDPDARTHALQLVEPPAPARFNQKLTGMMLAIILIELIALILT